MAFTDLEIRNAWQDSLAAGFTPEQIYQGAASNFGLTREQVDAALANTQTVTTSSGQSFDYDALVKQIEARYAEGKNPTLAVKSALQLGIPEDVIAILPGVTAADIEAGKGLLSSGAFANTATGTSADAQAAAPVGSDQYNARIAAGLDAFGFPPEEVARLRDMGLYGPGKAFDPGTDSNSVASQVQSVLANSQAGYNPEMAYTPVGQFQVDGKTYTVNPDGSYYATEELGGGNIASQVYDASGNLTNDFTYNRNESTYLTPVVNSLLAAAGGAVLGPAGAGLLGTPAAAAVGSGGTTLFRGGSVEDALKSAALAGTAAYGIQSLFGGAVPVGEQQALELTLADDIAQLSQQGLQPAQIADVLSSGYGIDPTAALESVVSSLGSSGAGQTINVLGNSVPTESLFSNIIPSLASNLVGQTVPVEGSRIPTDNLLESVIPSLTAALNTGTLPQAGQPTSQVEVTGSRDTGSLGNIIASLVPAAAGAVATPVDTGSQRVEVTAKKDNNLLPVLGGAAAAGLGLPADITKELPKATQPTRKESSLFNPSDILKVLGLLGGLTAGKGAITGGNGTGRSQASTSPLATTNPQYGDDYYKQLQGYYNTYMPQYPRDVATPLRAWYEGTGGAMPASMPSQSAGTSQPQGLGAPGTVVGSLFSSMLPEASQQSFNPADISYGLGPTNRPQLKSFKDLPQEQQAASQEYLKTVVPILAANSLSSGTGWGNFSQLSNNFRLDPETLLSYMPEEQRKQFQDKFSYQLGQNSRLYEPGSVYTTERSAEFSPQVPAYLQEATQLLNQTADPVKRKELERIIYSGAAIGGSPYASPDVLPAPWWAEGAKSEDIIRAYASGNPEQYFKTQAQELAKAPLSQTFSDAARRSTISKDGYDISFSVDGTPYIERVNLFGDRPIERLKAMYDLTDAQITDLISSIPIEAFNPRKRASEPFGYVPFGLSQYYRGYKDPSGAVPEFAPEDVPRLVREGLLPPGS